MTRPALKTGGTREWREDPKSMFGFGPIGWIACGVATGLLIAGLSGFDFLEWWLMLLGRLFGPRAIDVYMYRLHIPHQQALLYPSFGLIMLAVTLVAIQIHPKRFNWPWWVAIVLIAIVTPLSALWRGYIFNPVAGLFADVKAWELVGQPLLWLLTMIPSLVLLALLTRSRIVVVVYSVLLALNLAALQWRGSVPQPLSDDSIRSLIWHIALAIVLLWWATEARFDPRLRPHNCPACGYNLRSALHAGCSECGWGRPEDDA